MGAFSPLPSVVLLRFRIVIAILQFEHLRPKPWDGYIFELSKKCQALSDCFQERSLKGRHGRVEERGGEPHEGLPSQKGILDPPFDLPRMSLLVLPVQKSTTEQARGPFGGSEGSSFLLGGCLLRYVYLPPYVVHPPYHAPRSSYAVRSAKLPTDLLFLGINWRKSYRYRYWSVKNWELIKLPVPIRTALRSGL